MRKTRWTLWGITFLTLVCLRVSLPKIPISVNKGPLKFEGQIGGPISLFGKVRRQLDIKKGLDIQGGIHLVMKAEMADIPDERRGDALDAAKEVIERRVNLFGVSEPNIQTSRSGDEHRELA